MVDLDMFGRPALDIRASRVLGISALFALALFPMLNPAIHWCSEHTTIFLHANEEGELMRTTQEILLGSVPVSFVAYFLGAFWRHLVSLEKSTDASRILRHSLFLELISCSALGIPFLIFSIPGMLTASLISHPYREPFMLWLSLFSVFVCSLYFGLNGDSLSRFNDKGLDSMKVIKPRTEIGKLDEHSEAGIYQIIKSWPFPVGLLIVIAIQVSLKDNFREADFLIKAQSDFFSDYICACSLFYFWLLVRIIYRCWSDGSVEDLTFFGFLPAAAWPLLPLIGLLEKVPNGAIKQSFVDFIVILLIVVGHYWWWQRKTKTSVEK